MRTLLQATEALTFGVLALAVLSCDAGSFVEPDIPDVDDDPIRPVVLSITGLDDPVAADDTVALRAEALDQHGRVISIDGLEWTSSEPSIAEVTATSGNGAMLTAATPGTTTITAAYGNLAASTAVEVHHRPVDLHYVSGSGQSAPGGAELPEPLVVLAEDRRGDAIDGVSVTFQVVDGGGSVATTDVVTDADGLASTQWTLGAAGEQRVRAVADPNQARVKNMKDSVVVFTATAMANVASLDVTPNAATVAEGDSLQLTVSASSADGSNIGDPGVDWESSDTSVASVSDRGVLRGRKGGQAFAVARYMGASGSVSDSAEVTVTAETRTITAIELDPATAVVDTGSTLQFRATGTLGDGSQTGVSVAWSATGGSISGDGLFTAGGTEGSFEVIATHAQGPADTAEVTIVAPEPVPVRLSVSPDAVAIEAGFSVQFTARAFDANGTEVTSVEFSWTSSDSEVATVSSSGRVTAKATGAALIVAAAAGLADTASVTVEPSVTVTSPPPSGSGIWFSAEELQALPTSGEAWENVLRAADSDLSGGVLTTRNDHNARVLAAALVAARLDDNAYRVKVRDALIDLMAAPYGTEDGLARNRRLGTYAIAADLIGLASLDPSTDEQFRDWVVEARDQVFSSGGGGDLASYHERRPNNYGNHAGFSRMAVALYLGDTQEFERAVTVFRGWLGDRSAYAGFDYRQDFTWHADPDNPVGINPAGSTKEGHSIDGVLPDDQRRCGSFQWPPCLTNYAWEGLQGALGMAWIAYRNGYDAFNWSDQALRRAVTWLYTQADYPAEGDDLWQVHIVNSMYGTNFATRVGVSPGKNMGWTDWTHGN